MEDFNETVENFSNKLLERGYTTAEIAQAKGKVSHTNRSQLVHKQPTPQPTKGTPTFFSTTYNPAVNHRDLRRALNKHWPHIQSKDTLRKIFPNPPPPHCLQKGQKHTGTSYQGKTSYAQH